MQFNSDLYWALAEVFPNITVRSLSKMMGKSAGYWSSINAQQQSVGASALVHLLDALECQKILAPEGGARRLQLEQLSVMITQELISRFKAQTGLEPHALSAAKSKVRLDNSGAMPFLMASYY
ncbi:hypothetical protein [Limnohabitans sp. Hippo4]|uniref:hypothetical protein n=1 Tax=Limnohabitans sp. Hippo4 TaxID=1826167 RepID=UPI000D37625A|nr:hypothetical protein [Limnohabitans sp. Hippo4]PUE37159.1 hypothetical protein B9Z46_00005 [Limnohabitans sp. Hippo4]